MTESLRHLLAARFPESAGYEIEASRLTGPLGGAVFRVSRGDFRARISLQIYRRGPKTSADTHELRLFGSVSSGRIERARRTGSRWQSAGRALGIFLGVTIFLGAAWVMGLLFGHSPLAPGSPLWVASVLPAGLLGWMGGTATHQSLARRARLLLRAASSTAGEDERLTTALQAWNTTVPALTDQRELAAAPGLAQPFRGGAWAAGQ